LGQIFESLAKHLRRKLAQVIDVERVERPRATTRQQRKLTMD
jgi:hypothetical protein